MESEDAKNARGKADETGEIVLVRDIDIRLFDHGTDYLAYPRDQRALGGLGKC
jgi:hypothetical protein